MAQTARIIEKDHGWKRIMRETKRGDSSHAAVGITAAKDGRGDEFGNVEIGAVHEFGSPSQGIPERSFIRSTVENNATTYRSLAKVLAIRVIEGRLTRRKALGIFGLRVAADIKRTIQAGIDPPLKDATIERKRSSKQLIDTGQLLGSITHEVRDGRG